MPFPNNPVWPFYRKTRLKRCHSEAPVGFCSSSGKWNHVVGECECKGGYESEVAMGRQTCTGKFIFLLPFWGAVTSSFWYHWHISGLNMSQLSNFLYDCCHSLMSFYGMTANGILPYTPSALSLVPYDRNAHCTSFFLCASLGNTAYCTDGVFH